MHHTSENDFIMVIVGEPGSGKSFISRNLLTKYPNLEIIKKYTSRKPRMDEENVLDVQGGTSIDDITKMDYYYINHLNQEYYGFQKREIDKALENGKIPCVDFSSEEVYLQLTKDYPNKVLLLKIVPYFDETSMRETFEKQGRDYQEFEERKSTLENPITDWVYQYANIREIINPSFLKACSEEVSLYVLARRIESIVQEECKKELGFSYSQNQKEGKELYEYLYFYSKNRPIDSEMNLVGKTFQ